MRRLKSPVVLLAVSVALPVLAQDQPIQEQERYAELNALVARREYAHADRIIRQLLGSSTDPATTYFQIGKVYFDHEAWKLSSGFLEKSLELNSGNDKAHQLLGLGWRQLHQPEKAEAELLEAAKENPSDKTNAYFAGQQLLLDGKCEAALPFLYSALDSAPLQLQTLEALGLAQARLGNYGLAESYFRKVVNSSDHGHYSALVNLSLLLLLGHDSAHLEEGLHYAQRAAKLEPASPEAHFLAGKALFKLGRLGEASQELTQAVKLNSEDSKSHFLLAQIYDRLGQPDRAQKERKDVARLQARQGQAGMSTIDPVPVAPENFLERQPR
jgi:tetratricopeptide (TPR) repeat protein